MTTYHIAQLNIASAVAPMDSAEMAEFMNALPEINTLAENTPGFVWRLKDDTDNATNIRPFDDDSILVNMSVWESIEALYQYAYYSQHADYFRRRAEWFMERVEPMVVLWWIPVGHVPTTAEAKAKLMHLREHGPTPQAFTFKQRFPAE